MSRVTCHLELGELREQPLVELGDPLGAGVHVPHDGVQVEQELPAVGDTPAHLCHQFNVNGIILSDQTFIKLQIFTWSTSFVAAVFPASVYINFSKAEVSL